MAIYQGEKKIAENVEIIQGAKIDDNVTADDTTWSSNKISSQLQSVDAVALDGKSADVFLQNQGILSSGDLFEHILTMTSSGFFFAGSGVTNTPVEGQWFWIDVRRDERGNYCVTATRYNQGGVYTNRYNNNADMLKWYGWSNVADGKLALTGGTMTGTLVAQANTAYTTAQVRNATMSTADPSGGSNGQVHYKYS